MFSLPSSWSSHSVLGHAFSLDFWLAHLKSWHHSDRANQSKDTPGHDLRNPFSITTSPDLRSLPDCLILNLPSPTIHWSFEYISEALESDSESESECSHITSSQDQFMTITNLDGSPNAKLSTITRNNPTQTIVLPSSDVVRRSLLSQYSEQELVLLEFLTHSPDVKACDIDEVLGLYPPGFSNGCCCDPNDDEGQNLCEVCQLTEAYLDYSFERFQTPQCTV